MRRRPPRSTRTDTRFPYTTLFLSAEIAALGEAYLSRKRSFPVRTREELAALFEDAGFALECFADLEDANPGDSRPVGPTMPGGATYVKLIARKPYAATPFAILDRCPRVLRDGCLAASSARGSFLSAIKRYPGNPWPTPHPASS